jgi:hypothetical protein
MVRVYSGSYSVYFVSLCSTNCIDTVEPWYMTLSALVWALTQETSIGACAI